MIEFMFATASQLEEVARLERECLTKPWNKEQLNEFLTNGGKILLIIDSGLTVGYISFKIILDEAEINNLAVCAECRNRGYAEALLNQAETFMTDNGVTVIYLEVSEHNYAALKLYSKQNYSQYNLRKNYYKEGDNAVLMQKKIDKT